MLFRPRGSLPEGDLEAVLRSGAPYGLPAGAIEGLARNPRLNVCLAGWAPLPIFRLGFALRSDWGQLLECRRFRMMPTIDWERLVGRSVTRFLLGVSPWP